MKPGFISAVTWTHKNKPMKIHKVFVKFPYTTWKFVCGGCAVQTPQFFCDTANSERYAKAVLLKRTDRRRKQKSSMQDGSPTNWNPKWYSTNLNFSVWHRLCFVGEATIFCSYWWIYWHFSSTNEISCHGYHIFLSGRNKNICRGIFLGIDRTQTNGRTF
jgi:hypothetical protein